MLATQRLISFAMKLDSSFSFVNEVRKGVVPRACEVWSDLGMRFLSESRLSVYDVLTSQFISPSATIAIDERNIDAVDR